MNDIQKRRFFQRVKSSTQAQFWAMMEYAHTQAYQLGQKHVREAMESHPRLYPKLVREVFEKAEQIREEWDGITESAAQESVLEVFAVRGQE